MTIEELVAEARNHVENFPLSDGDVLRVTRLADALESLSALSASDNEAEALKINYCPEHGDLLSRPGDGADARSYRCREAHHRDEIHAGYRRQSPLTQESLIEVITTTIDSRVKGRALSSAEFDEGLADAILSSLSVPERAKVKPYRRTIPDVGSASADYWRGVADAEDEITSEYGIPVEKGTEQ